MIALELLPAVLRGMADNDRLGNVWNRDDCEAVAQAAEVLQTLLPSAPGAIEPDRPRSDEKNSAARQPLVGLSDEYILALAVDAGVVYQSGQEYPGSKIEDCDMRAEVLALGRAIESALRAHLSTRVAPPALQEGWQAVPVDEMTITFQGHVSEMRGGGANSIVLTIQTPMDPCGGKPFIVAIPSSQAKHWLPGRMVSFSLYTLPEPESAPPVKKGADQ